MATKRMIHETDGIFFITITCYKWLQLFQITNTYNAVYKWFNYLKEKGHYITGYVIMPNHIHALIAFSKTDKKINKIIGNAKRLLAYEIIKHLKQQGNIGLLNQLAEAVEVTDKKRGKLHEVFEDSFDNQILLVDVAGVNLNIKTKNQTIQTSKIIYLYNSENRSLLAGDQKLINKLGIHYIKSKPVTKAIIEKYLVNINETNSNSTSPNNLKKIVSIANSVCEAITILDIIQYTNPDEYLKSITTPHTPELYMASFKPGNKSDIQLWYNYTKEEELQLAISLIHTKLKKLNYAGIFYIKKLIELDLNESKRFGCREKILNCIFINCF